MAQTLPQETGTVDTPPTSAQWACLFTKHKTQKHKVWHDGRLVLQNCLATLYNANPPPGSADPVLDECEISAHQRHSLVEQHENQMETENYLIQLDGPWTPRTNTGPKPTAPASGTNSSMQKLLSRKYQKPKRFVPPSKQPTQSWQTRMVKRRRPLQPGELHLMHHGAPAPPPASLTPLLPRQNTALSPIPNAHIQPQQQIQNSSYPSSFQAGQVSPHQTPQEEQCQVQGVSLQPKESFVSALELSGSTSNSGTKQTSQGGFVSNDFNASSFYGLDEEEEIEEDATPSAFVPYGAPPPAFLDKAATTTTTAAVADQQESPKSTRPVPNSTNTGMGEQQACARSTNDVLALFGAAPDSDHAQPNPSATNAPQEQPSRLQFNLAPIDASDESEDGF
eukprot:Nitzschia sp. Nitz4//scaffold2_size372955//139349//140530//NITZ4_000402-RA/size372955-processed-gene-0.494-mRNA-1//-1//CDS//3329546715//614//frame0